MPTLYSKAYLDLRSSLNKPNALRKLEKSYADPPVGSDVDIVEALRSATIVLLVATFEAFLRDLFEERMGYLSSVVDAPKFARLPPDVRVASVFNGLDHAMKSMHGRRVPHEKHLRILGIQAVAVDIVNQKLTATAFASTDSNPGPDTVTRMFKDAGVSKIFDRVHPRFQGYWGPSVSQNFEIENLKFLVGLRNEVAHGSSSLSQSRDDLKHWERFVRILARSLDDELKLHVKSLAKV